MTGTLAPTHPLTAADRCDRCGAQAYVRVVLNSGGDLLFCAHHMHEHDDSIRKIAAEVQDETNRLHEAPAAASEDER
ncbi:DUF7455 domain-containing protein [Halostreptopolyspora alba]|uniref:DUF7455 domain-containing protein n=1 Tax=Halostreptopolyspora alba TaxID=2487137 RepID=A0A3N0EHR1_9ACTN|nr:hypothetical protein EFW17_00910 [Nocardiopsaceae bacterium YIM 96095]